MTRAAKPFANLAAALRTFDAGDLCGDLELISADSWPSEAVRLEEACDSLRCAESVETIDDFVANLRDAAESIRELPEAASVAAEIARILARCAA